jgi:hypothetical protein
LIVAISKELAVRIDLEDFRQHYASLSDEALFALDRSELVEEAQKCYDEELARRQLSVSDGLEYSPDSDVAATLPSQPPNRKRASSNVDSGAKPDWLDDAACACAFSSLPGDTAPEVDLARAALESAGIPCYISLRQVDPPRVAPQPEYQYEVMVPGDFCLEARGILDKEIFNARIEADLRNHLQGLSDEELSALNPQILTVGLLDQIERLTRVYNEELDRRKLQIGEP